MCERALGRRREEVKSFPSARMIEPAMLSASGSLPQISTASSAAAGASLSR